MGFRLLGLVVLEKWVIINGNKTRLFSFSRTAAESAVRVRRLGPLAEPGGFAWLQSTRSCVRDDRRP